MKMKPTHYSEDQDQNFSKNLDLPRNADVLDQESERDDGSSSPSVDDGGDASNFSSSDEQIEFFLYSFFSALNQFFKYFRNFLA